MAFLSQMERVTMAPAVVEFLVVAVAAADEVEVVDMVIGVEVAVAVMETDVVAVVADLCVAVAAVVVAIVTGHINSPTLIITDKRNTHDSHSCST